MNKFVVCLCVGLLFLTGCAQKEPLPPPPQVVVAEKDDTPKREEIIKNALKHLHKKDGGDCSGFVSLVNNESSVPFFDVAELNGYFEDSRRSLAIYNLLEDQNRTYQENPKVGDLVFFANTVKKYAKKKSIDNITHIGIVTQVDSDETVHFIHHTKGRNLISQMNLTYPTVAKYDNKNVNSYMEKCSVSQSHQCLAPSYFSAYGRIK